MPILKNVTGGQRGMVLLTYMEIGKILVWHMSDFTQSEIHNPESCLKFLCVSINSRYHNSISFKSAVTKLEWLPIFHWILML